MDLKDAHALFKRYRGWLYMMAREENEKYHDFLALNIPKTTLESWRQELLGEYYDKAQKDSQRAIFELYDIARILKATTSLKEENGKRTLSLLEKLLQDPDSDKALLMRIIYGDNDSYSDSLLCWIEKNTNLEDKLKEILNDSIEVY